MSNNNFHERLNSEFAKLVSEKWAFMQSDWPINPQNYFHTCELKRIKNIDIVKQILNSKIGVIPVFYFLTVLYTSKGYIGPYPEVEKGYCCYINLFQVYQIKNLKSLFHIAHLRKFTNNFGLKDMMNQI